MDGNLQASVRLLFHILSKRAEKVKEADLEQLVLWARNKGKLQKPSLIFSKVESQELGQLLWDAVKEGGEEREAVLAPRPPAAAAAAAVAATRRRRSAARRYLAAANSPARLGGAGHSPASRIAETVTQRTAAQTPAPGSPHPTTVALRCPLPPSSDSDDSEPDPPVVNCSRNKRSQNKIQRQEKVTESPSSSLVERVGRTKATGCGGEQQGAAVSTGQPPGRTAERQAERGQTERGRRAPSLRRPRGGADIGRETEGSLLLSSSARREMGVPGGSAALESEQAGRGRGRGVSSPIPTVTQQGRERDGAAPLISPQHPAMAAETAAQPGCHGNDNAESSSATDGEMATPQQKFQQHFSNSLQESEDAMKKYSSTKCFPRYQEGWTLCKSKLFQIQCG